MPYIDFVCWLGHDGDIDRNHDGPTITLVERTWAYCSAGGTAKHQWERIAPMAVAELQAMRIVRRVARHSVSSGPDARAIP